MMHSSHYPSKQHSVFKLVSNKEAAISASNRKFEFSPTQRKTIDNESKQMSKSRETDHQHQFGQKLESERLSSLHENLHKEADKIRKWKANTELEIKQKDRKIQECATTIESLRKSLLELQLENESLSLKLQEEISNRADIQQRINTTREICAYVKEHSLTTDSIMEKCTEEKEELRALQNEQQKKFEDLLSKFKSLEVAGIKEQEELLDHLTKEREKNVLSERTWTEKLVEAELKLKDLMYLCDEKDIEIRDIRTVVNKNEDKIHDLNDLIDNLQSQLHSTQENLNQTESRLLASEKKLCSSKADVGTLEKKVKEVSEHHMIKVASEKALQEELESLRKAREADLKVFNEEVDMLKKIITDDKQRINDLGTLLERTDNAVEELKSARDILIMEKCEIEAKLHQLLDEKLNVERCHSSEKERAEQLKNHLSNVKKELENSKAVADQQKELLKQLGEDLDASNTEKVNQHNELTTITCEMNRKIEEVNQLKQEILFSEEQKQQLLFKVEEMEGHLKEKRELFCKIEGQLEESKEEIMKLQAHIKEKNNNIEELQIHIQEEGRTAEEKFHSAVEAENEARQTISELKKELDDLTQQNNDLLSAQAEQDKTLHGEIETTSKEKERLQAMIKSLKEDNTSNHKQIKELEKEIRSLKTKMTSQTKANEEKDKEAESMKTKLKKVSEGKEAVEKEKSELKSQVSEEKKITKKAIKEVESMKKEMAKMEKEKASVSQNCDLQIKEMTDMLAKYQNENARVISQKDKEIQSLKKNVQEFEESIHKEGNKMQEYYDKELERLTKETENLRTNIQELQVEKNELEKNAQLTLANFEEDGNSKAKELEELRRKFEEVTTKDLVSTCIQTSPMKNVLEENTPLSKQTSIVPCTPKVPVHSNQSVFNDRLMNTYLPTTPKANMIQRTYETPKSLIKPSVYVTPSRSTINTPQRSILRASCSSSVQKKRRVAFASDGDTVSDAESSSSEMMDIEVGEIDLRYKDGKQFTPLLVKPSPRFTPYFSMDEFEEEKENKRENTPKSKSSLSLNRVPRGPPVSRKHESQKKLEVKDKDVLSTNTKTEPKKTQNVRKAAAKQQGKFFKNSPKERLQKSKLSSFKKKDESWFDLDAVFGFED